MKLRHADQRHEIKAIDVKRAAKADAFARIIAHFPLSARKVKPQRPSTWISSSSAGMESGRRLRIALIYRHNAKRIKRAGMFGRNRQNRLIMFGCLFWLARLLRPVSAVQKLIDPVVCHVARMPEARRECKIASNPDIYRVED
jgi:hypothetical protein